MKITVLSENKSLEEYIDKSSSGNIIDSFLTIEDLLDKVKKSSHRTQLLLVQDNAIPEDKFDCLIDLLNHKFFYCDKIVFLNLALNTHYLSRYEFIIEEVKRKKLNYTIDIKTQDGFKAIDLLKIIKEGTVDYTDIPENDVAIIQTARSTQRKLLSNRKLEEKAVDGVFIDKFESDKEHIVINSILEQDNQPIDLKSNFNVKIDIDNFDKHISKIEKETYFENETKLKYLAITGSRNSGVTSSVITMGMCASSYGKTLIVDCDTVSMGLSLLAESFIETPLLLEKSINPIPIDSLLKTKSIKHIKISTMNSEELHFLTLDYKSVSKLSDMPLVIINIINQIKDNYRYIIFDIPLELINTYELLLNKFTDKLLLTNIPYVNKTVNLLRKIKEETIIPITTLFNNDNVIIYNVGIPNQNNLPVLLRSELNSYINSIFEKNIKSTKIFQLKSGNYLEAMEHFNSIMEVKSL